MKKGLEMRETHQPLPRARQNQLITKELAGEMLVYDLDTNEAHCLNATAARVWAHCDGVTTVAKMARLLTDEMQTSVADEVVLLALEQLRKARLLQESWAEPAQIPQVSRRSVVMRLGFAAAVTVPFISSITAPTAAEAGTPKPTPTPCGAGAAGAPCTVNGDCCSNNCVDNGRGGFQCT
jgi:hypothetical protein